MLRKVTSLLIIATMLTCLLPIYTQAAVDTPIISIKLSNYLGNKKEIILGVTGEYIDGDDNSLKASNYTLKLSDGSLKLFNGSTLIKDYGSSFTITPSQYGTNNYVSINSIPYLGTFKFTIENGYIRPINTLHIEDYLKGVVPKEMSASKPIEALKAQALAARTYVVRYAGSTISDTQSHQVYGGYLWKDSNVYSKSTRAVEETQGKVITYNGNPIEAFYSSTNGGMILSNENAWGTNNDWYPYLVKKEDPYDLRSGSPYVNWDITLNKTQINLADKDLKTPENWWSTVTEEDASISTKIKNWMANSDLINSDYEMKIVSYDNVEFTTNFTSYDLLSGKITYSYILKNTKEDSYRKDANGNIQVFSYSLEKRSYSIRSILGTTTMYGPYVKEVVNDPNQFIIKGGGFGHGIGMSQWGAYQMAAEGINHEDIVSFYYPGTKIGIETILLKDVNLVSVEANIASPQTVDTIINITANATGGAERQYRFHLYDGETWKLVRDYSTNNQFAWTPSEPGNYKFSVHAKDTHSSKDYDDYMTLDYEVLPKPVSVDSVTADKQSPQAINTPITIKANASGGLDRQYRFYVYDGKEWVVLQDYSSSDTVTWSPMKSGTYKFSVHVKDKNSTKAYDDYGTLTYEIAAPVDATGITADVASPQLVNTPITLTTNATGGLEKLYKIHVHDGNEWIILQEYAASNKYTWTPNEPGNYKFSVHVKDKNSSNSYDDYVTMNYSITAEKLKFDKIETSKTSPQPANVSVDITASATGGSETLYKFHVYDEKWIILQDYAPSNTINWTPTKPGSYKFSVHVKEKSSSRTYDDFGTMTYQVSEPVKATGLSFDKTSPQQAGQLIKIKANATGSNNLLYKFFVYDGQTWNTVQDYQSSNTLNWIPEAGDYKVVVHVKDAGSVNAYDSYTYEYFSIKQGPVTLVSVDKQYESPQPANTAIRLTANATGGTDKLYKFHIYDGEKWTVLRDYESANSIVWSPDQPGDYKISVHVKDSNSTKSYDDYKAFEYKIQ